MDTKAMTPHTKSTGIVGALAGIIGFGIAPFAQAAPSQGQGANAGFAVISATPRTLSEAGSAAADKTATPGLVSADKKTLTFSGKTVRLVARSGPASDMLSYRIDGLRSPTLVVPRGATMQVLFINTDDDMFHNIRFGAWRTSWPADAAPLMKTSVGTPPLPHGIEASRHAESLTLRAPLVPGKYAYFCTVRGHAPGGMYGTIIVR